jgi:hypothetical protein
MFEKALIFLREQLNNYILLKTGVDGKIKLTPLLDGNGKVVVKDLGIVLVNLEEEQSMRNQNPFQVDKNGNYSKVNPEINLNIYLLIVANFGDKESDYRESLKFLSYVASFFQSRNVFTPGTHPSMDPLISRLAVDLVSLSFENQNNLWGALGTKYMPSLLYRVRMIRIKEDEVMSEAPPITQANLTD